MIGTLFSDASVAAAQETSAQSTAQFSAAIIVYSILAGICLIGIVLGVMGFITSVRRSTRSAPGIVISIISVLILLAGLALAILFILADRVSVYLADKGYDFKLPIWMHISAWIFGIVGLVLSVLAFCHRFSENTQGKVKLTVLRVIVYTILVFLTFLCLFFFYLMVVNASRSNAELATGFSILPKGNFINNLKNAWNDASIDIPRGMLNSLIIAVSSALITTYFSALTAYGIHAYNFRGKKLVFTFIMAIMMIPSQVSALGFLQLMTKWNLTDSYIPLIVPGIAAPVVFFYMKQYMESVLPLDVIDAARVDGSNEFRTFNTIVLPMIKPAIAVQMIFSFVSSWNNYFIPALLLNKPELKTVPIMIAQLRSADYSKFDMGKVYMFILLAILPVMIVYIILSKSIIKGVTAGSVKG